MHLIINSKAGSVIKAGEDGIRALVDASGALFTSVNFVEPDDISGQLDRIANDDMPVLIGGGDGTVARCLPYFIKHRKTMGVLPLGTMNLIAQDLGFPSDLADALNLYAQKTATAKIDVGRVNDLPFLCCVGYGTMPESAVYREDNRGQSDVILYPKLVKFVFDQMDPDNQRRVTLSMDHKKKHLKTAALVISNNLFATEKQLDNGGFIKRASLQNGHLGVYTVSPRTFWDKLRIALRLRLGGWKDDKTIREWRTRTAQIDGKDKKALISIDGEVLETSMPLQFHIEPQSLSVIVPVTAEGIKKVA